MEKVYQVLDCNGWERTDNLAIVNRILYHGGQVKFLDRGIIVISAPDDVFASTVVKEVKESRAHKKALRRAQSILSDTLKNARLLSYDKRNVCAVLNELGLNIDAGLDDC